MKQLYYLTAAKDTQRLDGLCNELDISIASVAIEKVKSLTSFLGQQILHLQNFIIIDLTEAAYSQEHILQAVQRVRSISAAEIIFIAPDNEDTTLLYGKLAAFRVNRLIKLKSDTDYITEVRRMLTAKDEDFAFQTRMGAITDSMITSAKKIIRPVTIPPGLVMNISVAGTMRRIGTTTQTFALWHYFKSLGFIPAVQLTDAKMLHILIELYKRDVQEEDHHVLIRGIPFCSKPQPAFNAYIADLGVLTTHNAAQFALADLSILVTGIKPWEFAELGTARNHLSSCKPRQFSTLVSFAGDQKLDAVRSALGGSFAAVPYHPDIWEAGTTAAYQAAILPHIKKYCEA